MDLKLLNTFIQVAESGSFTRAGEQLGYSQPTISVQIRQLEEELGMRLFDRIGNTVRLTERGHEALQHAQQICRMCLEMVQPAADARQLQGCIRLATADSLCGPLLGEAFVAFRKQWPNIRLKIFTAGTDELFRMLDHNEADIVCTLDSHIYQSCYINAVEERVGIHFVTAPDHPLAAQPQVTVQQLLQWPFLLTEKDMSYRRFLDEALAKRSREVQPVLEMSRCDVICDLVEQGMGISFLPDYVTEAAVRRGSLCRLEVPELAPEIWKQVLYHRDKWVSPQMQTVIDYLISVMQGPKEDVQQV